MIKDSVYQSTVLVVDEVPSSRRAVRVFLKSLGFNDVVEAASGADALEAIQNKAVQIIFSDHEMADLPACELCRQVRAHAGYENVPFVMLASLKGEAFIEQARQAGVSAYLPKPIQFLHLEEKIHEVLARPSSLL